MKTIKHKFVEFIPDTLEDGIIYITVEYRTAIHNCICGCRNKVVTPLSPSGWRLTFDGRSISLSPSIGNWNFECKSHYFITNNEIRFARRWGQKEIDEGRKEDSKYKNWYFKKRKK